MHAQRCFPLDGFGSHRPFWHLHPFHRRIPTWKAVRYLGVTHLSQTSTYNQTHICSFACNVHYSRSSYTLQFHMGLHGYTEVACYLTSILHGAINAYNVTHGVNCMCISLCTVSEVSSVEGRRIDSTSKNRGGSTSGGAPTSETPSSGKIVWEKYSARLA